MAVVVPIVSTFDGAGVRSATRGFDQLGKSTSAFGQSLKRAVLPATLAIAGIGTALVSATKAAMEDQKAQVELARSLRATVNATDKQIAQTEKFVSSTSLASGVLDDDLRPALARLVRGTGNLGKAQKALGLALDISQATGKSLATVSDALSKGFKGNLTALSRLSPEVKSIIKGQTRQITTTNSLGKEITKTVKVAGTFDQVLQSLTKNYGGASAQAAGTLEGQYRTLNVAINETKEAIGVALLPFAERFFKLIKGSILPYVEKLTRALEKDGLSGALKTAGEDVKKFIENADGLDGTLINLGITAGVVVTAFKGFGIISSIVAGLGGITSAIGSLGPVLGGFAATTLGTVAAAFGAILATIYLLVDTLRSPESRTPFINWAKNVAGAIGNVFIGLINTLAFSFNQLIRAANWLNPFADIPKFEYLDWMKMSYDTNQYTGGTRTSGTAGGVRKMADGGIVTRPTFAMIGEAGPEAVIPLNKAGAMGNVNIHVHTGVADPVAVGKTVVEALVAYQRRSGALPLRVA